MFGCEIPRNHEVGRVGESRVHGPERRRPGAPERGDLEAGVVGNVAGGMGEPAEA